MGASSHRLTDRRIQMEANERSSEFGNSWLAGWPKGGKGHHGSYPGSARPDNVKIVGTGTERKYYVRYKNEYNEEEIIFTQIRLS
ncbi:uncharacterized protein B0T23DRAFT_315871 [Neurospora hispaniola]|uniref:Uncharacterized protein n=1 Tax=Neurospora hispaniola TaxID=588809 RepID=A0AAJ0I6W8_9PEZI|nr:hypothetical protein B0T23DRAFT_315871 [Neurospora hispaniola]